MESRRLLNLSIQNALDCISKKFNLKNIPRGAFFRNSLEKCAVRSLDECNTISLGSLRHPNFQHGTQTKGGDPGSLFSSLLRLEMTFFHSILRAASLNGEEAHKCKKMATGEVCVFSGGKTAENGSASAQRST